MNFLNAQKLVAFKVKSTDNNNNENGIENGRTNKQTNDVISVESQEIPSLSKHFYAHFVSPSQKN